MSQYRLPTSRDWLIAALAITALMAAVLAIIYFGVPKSPVAAIIAICGALLLLVHWHAATTAYRCSACENEFEISTWRDLISPHMIDTKYLRCPACGRRTWALALKKIKSPQNRKTA